MSFSENLKVLRKQKGFSQEQLAQELNVSRQAVSKWESEQGYPEMETLIMLSELFSCSLDTLLKGNFIESDSIEKTLSREEYEKQHNRFSKMITFGVCNILVGIIFLIASSSFIVKDSNYENVMGEYS